jgi:hypothetical protein
MSVIIEVDHRPNLCVVRDQGARPTCLAFATTAAHEFARRSKEPLSPEYLHYFASGRCTSVGVTFSEVARALKEEGQPTEIVCPYRLGGAPNGWAPPVSADVYRRDNRTHQASVTKLYEVLRGGYVPVLGISLPKPFFAPVEPWVLTGEGQCLGMHAVVAVGIGSYEQRGCFLVRNSWGTGWGKGGHVWLSEEFITRHMKALSTLTDEVH